MKALHEVVIRLGLLRQAAFFLPRHSTTAALVGDSAVAILPATWQPPTLGYIVNPQIVINPQEPAMPPTQNPQRRSGAQRMADSLARRAVGAAPEVPFSAVILASDKQRVDRIARHLNTQKSVALMQALRLAENQLVSGLDAEARARYFADSAQ